MTRQRLPHSMQRAAPQTSNGLYDDIEQKRWMFTTAQDGASLLPGDYDLDAGTFALTPDRIQGRGNLSLVFWLESGYPHPPLAEVFLRFPSGSYTANGLAIDGVHPVHESLAEGPGGRYKQYYFSMGGILPEAPWNGDYVLRLSGLEYWFRNLAFVTVGDSPEGWTVPAADVIVDGAGAVSAVRWQWFVVSGDRFVPAAAEAVRLTVRQFYFYELDGGTSAPERFGLDYAEGGTIQGSLPAGATSLRFDYWDRAGNDFAFRYAFR